MEVKIKRLSHSAILPTYGSEKAAGMDLYADLGYHNAMTTDGLRTMPNFVDIDPHTNHLIGCGFAFQPPEGYVGLIFARSGMASKQHMRPSNCVGVCDEDYRGEYKVTVHNDGTDTQIIRHGDRIAQLMFIPYEQAKLIEVDSLDDTDRGSGGFGSTGV